MLWSNKKSIICLATISLMYLSLNLMNKVIQKNRLRQLSLRIYRESNLLNLLFWMKTKNVSLRIHLQSNTFEKTQECQLPNLFAREGHQVLWNTVIKTSCCKIYVEWVTIKLTKKSKSEWQCTSIAMSLLAFVIRYNLWQEMWRSC
jgi:hypothetical protein